MYSEQDEDTFASVAWDNTPSTSTADPTSSTAARDDQPSATTAYDVADAPQQGTSAGPSSPTLTRRRSTGGSEPLPDWEGYLLLEVKNPVKELEGTKDSFVSYQVSARTDLPIYTSRQPTSRRRFQDFVFLHDHLVKDFPAALIPPLPDKSRLKYVTGDRFSPEFIERRRAGLQRFLERLARHPVLCRAKLLRNFVESTEWNVDMHTHLAHPPMPDEPSSLLEMASDTLLNAFSKVRKPDERFVEIKDGLDRFEERLLAIERIENRTRSRVADLCTDYEDLASSVQGLGYLETGITEPLARFESALLDFALGLRDLNASTTLPLLQRLHSLSGYSESLRTVLKLRDQKQLDFEDLSAVLSSITTERDRLAAGYRGLGIGSYLKEKMDSLRGGEVDGSREGKIYRLDGKIKDLQEAVTGAHETSDAFNDEVLREHAIFQRGKRAELREMLEDLADGHIAMYKKAIRDWEEMMPHVRLEISSASFVASIDEADPPRQFEKIKVDS